MALARRYFEPRDLLDTRVSLPPDPLSLRDLLRHRSSAMPGTSRPVSFSELATVLAATYGTEGKTRTVPSAGDLYPLVLHILVRKRLASLDPGLWWFDPSRTELRLVREGAIDLQPLIFAHWAVDPLVASGEPVVFISADLEHSAAKYSNRGYRYTLMEAGAAMQNAYLAAAELRLPIRAVGGFDDDPLHEALDLPDRVAPLLVILLGS
jgi:SagB-type dehydrogenase family enzyme